MKKSTPLIVLLFLSLNLMSQNLPWKIAGDKISTEWASKADPANVLPEYPRPQMVRNDWKSLNGMWDYSITDSNTGTPDKFDGKILVPFAPESALSGVMKDVGPDKKLWYHTDFTVPSAFRGKRVLLHFDAVDWESEIWVNGALLFTHKGGYDPFAVDITDNLKAGAGNRLLVKVTDPADKGPQPRGKQVLRPGGIWYTSVTGIWRSVWIEAVPKTYIASYRQVPDIDKGQLSVNVNIQNAVPGDIVRITALNGSAVVSSKDGEPGKETIIPVQEPRLWSPEDPFLYDLKIAVIRKGKAIDEVKGYFGMRKISLGKDENGTLRMLLNNKFVFQYGPLDQGWWPDGLYTAPTDEALAFDILKTKAMGFNMIRKHVKVEPARWYYWCDKIGMLVWQDMPSGDMGGGKWVDRPGMEGDPDKTRTEASEKIYRTEWKAIIDFLYNFPSIIVWVPFNEGWGQFKTAEITAWTMEMDRSRLVNSASGGSFHNTGHILDLHNYPEPVMPIPELFGKTQAIVLGEFGGLGLPLEGHTWVNRNNWGYRTFPNADTLYTAYKKYVEEIIPFIGRGLSAAIYTQTTDCEIEVNGLLTYDRKVMKIPEDKLREVSSKLYDAGKKVVIR